MRTYHIPMAHTCDPCYLGGWDRESRLKASPGKTFQDSISMKKQIIKLVVVAHTCHSKGGRKYKIEDHSPEQLGKKRDPISNLARAKSVGVIAQVVEPLPIKHQSPKCKPQYCQNK
jgi:hypothetical protein